MRAIHSLPPFVKSDESDLLTVALFLRVRRVNRLWPLFTESDLERKRKKQKSEFPIMQKLVEFSPLLCYIILEEEIT